MWWYFQYNLKKKKHGRRIRRKLQNLAASYWDDSCNQEKCWRSLLPTLIKYPWSLAYGTKMLSWLENLTFFTWLTQKTWHPIHTLNWKRTWKTIDAHCSLLQISTKSPKSAFLHFLSQVYFWKNTLLVREEEEKKAKQADKVCLYGDERSRERAHPNMLTKLSRFWLIKILLLLSSHTSFFTMTSLAWHRWADWIWCEYVPLLMKCCPHVVNDCTRHLVSVWIFYTIQILAQYSTV